MREEKIYLPYFSVEENKLKYLNKYTICNLPEEEDIKQMILENYGVIIKKKEKTLNKKTKKVLALEPHPDDFALSALGYIKDDMDVTVLNVFSNMKLDSFTWWNHIKIKEEEYEKLRLLESEIAIEKVLNYKFISVRETSTRITNKTNEEIFKDISEVLEKIFKENHFDIIMIPMGIGEHPDHLCVFDYFIERYVYGKLKAEIILYPEYPYARCKKSYIDRLNKINNKFKLEESIVDIEDKLKNMINAISVYKSQFDDIDKNQMLAIVREDGRAVATEYNKEHISLVYYKIISEE